MQYESQTKLCSDPTWHILQSPKWLFLSLLFKMQHHFLIVRLMFHLSSCLVYFFELEHHSKQDQKSHLVTSDTRNRTTKPGPVKHIQSE